MKEKTPTLCVAKFGGSSLSDAAQFQKVKQIIEKEPSRRFVVPSAPGKRYAQDTKVTDLLYACYEKRADRQARAALLSQIYARYDALIAELHLSLSLQDDYAAIEAALAGKTSADYLASRGEYLNGKILAAYLNIPFVDAAEVIFFDEAKRLDEAKTAAALRARLSALDRAVIPGFYGADPAGNTVTFSRGGSDITGALVAAALDADVYENFTDVSGVLAADPRVVENPRPIPIITYRELRELSYMGASVLHEDAIFPVCAKQIPIHLQNTNDPDARGTWIVAKRETAEGEIVTGVAAKKGYSVISVTRDGMNAQIGFTRRLLSVLEDCEIPFEHMPTGIDSLSVVVPTERLNARRGEVLSRLEAELQPQSLYVEDGIALLAVVGQGMLHAKGNAARICDALAQADINIAMLALSVVEMTMIVGVAEADFEAAMRAVYARVLGE